MCICCCVRCLLCFLVYGFPRVVFMFMCYVVSVLYVLSVCMVSVICFCLLVFWGSLVFGYVVLFMVL